MPGPPREPTRLKLLKGNPGKRPLPRREPKVRALGSDEVRARCPFAADSPESDWWGYYADHFGPTAIISTVDLQMLGRLAQATADRVDLEKTLRKVGPLITTPKGLFHISPVYHLVHRARDREFRLLCEFGASPASRARVETVSEVTGAEANPWAALGREAG